MQWIPCSVAQWIPIECSGFHAAWRNGSWLNAVDSMQHGPIGLDWCTELHAEWLNALDSMQRCEIHPEWMQWIACSVGQCIQVACSGIHAACGNGYRLNAVDSLQNCVIDTNWAVDSMHQDSMQWIQCSIVKWIPIECSGFHAAWLNAVDSNQSGAMYLHWMKRIPCSLV